MNTDKFIFLDLDGVLVTYNLVNPDRSKWYNGHVYPFDTRCVSALNQILVKTGAEIVLTSDWRRVFSLEELDKIFKFNKVVKSPMNITEVKADRNQEIYMYIAENKISNFIIIDDIQLDIYRERFIRTQNKTGLLQSHVTRAVKLLK